MHLSFTAKCFGLILFEIGALLMLWTHLVLGYSFSPLIDLKEGSLVRTGPFKYVRHPMYLSIFIIVNGMALSSSNYCIFFTGNFLFISLWILRLYSEEEYELLTKEFDVQKIILHLEKQIKILQKHSQNKNYKKYIKKAKKLKLIFVEYQNRVNELLSKQWYEKEYEEFQFTVESVEDPLINFELNQQKHYRILQESMVQYIQNICKFIRKTILLSAIKSIKQPKDSYLEKYYDFDTDKGLREQYLNSIGNLRIGKILEDLDAFAGAVAYKHTDGIDENNERNMTIVTASVDSILLLQELKNNEKVRVRGRPIYVGNSSIECQVVVDQLKDSKYEQILTSYFTMVGLDKETNKSKKVNQLNPITDEDKALFELGKQRKIEKKEKSATHLFIHPPYTEEIRLLHDKFIETLKLEKTQNVRDLICEKKIISPEETRIENNLWMHPQFKNVHNKIFGGFVMRSAFEIAFINVNFFGSSFTDNGKPFCRFLYLDEIHFIEPISIGDIAVLSSKVVYLENNIVHCRVKVEVVHPVTKIRKTTNLFHFAFEVEAVDKILYPNSYKEGIYYLDAKRRHEKYLKIMKKK
eukprot:gene4467-7848_t